MVKAVESKIWSCRDTLIEVFVGEFSEGMKIVVESSH